jgi:hypothetical protein
MSYAISDVEKAAELWKLAIKTEHGLAIAQSADRRWFVNILSEARRVHVSTEESYHYVVVIPETPEDEVWIVRRYQNGQPDIQRSEREEQD